MARILIVDDEAAICWALRAYLSGEGHVVDTAGTAAAALEILRTSAPDVLVSDIRLPGMGGIEILERFREAAPDVPVILMTAYGSVDAAVRAMHTGAFEYLHKPLDLDQVRRVIDQALASRHASPAPGPPPGAEPAESGFVARLVGRSLPMREVYKLIGLVSQNDVTVLIEGESGVGKELVARAIHAYSPRQSAPFVAINCGSLPEALLESELFGYERGAFTGALGTKAGRFELAHGGTLFLDEIAALSPAHQAKLLRVLQDGRIDRLGGTRSVQVDVRVMAASNRSLREAVAAHEFREDLYFRLQVVTIRVPSLHERKEDLGDLVAHFLRLASKEARREFRGVDASAMAALGRYDWPGNVRELENVIRRATALARGNVIGLADLPPEITQSPAPAASATRSSLETAAKLALRHRLQDGPAGGGSAYHDLVEAVEVSLIQAALTMTGGNQVRAAELLGVHRATLRKRMPPRDGEPSGSPSGGI